MLSNFPPVQEEMSGKEPAEIPEIPSFVIFNLGIHYTINNFLDIVITGSDITLTSTCYSATLLFLPLESSGISHEKRSNVLLHKLDPISEQ